MTIGKKIRLNRIFSDASGRLCSVAIDHFSIYNEGLAPGLAHIKQTIKAIAAGQPDSVTMHRGLATSIWEPYAGSIPLILQSSFVRPDDSASEILATPEDAVRLGADAYAVVAYVRGKSEAAYLRKVADCVREAIRFEMPVMCHVYPRDPENPSKILFTPEDIAWAVHCISEVGVDVIKAPYCGDVEAHAQIVADCPQPLVLAGGPKTSTLEDGLRMMSEAMTCGVQGAIIGRNIWGVEDVTGAVLAFKAVIHDTMDPHEALMTYASAMAG